MDVSAYLALWGMAEHPFAAEEAWRDSVLLNPVSPDVNLVLHPDFVKVVGNLAQPGPAVVFGARGSGKTAMRLQLSRAVERWNTSHADRRVLLVPLDELNPVIDRLARRIRGKTPLETLQKVTLSDHMDVMLNAAVVRLMDQWLDASDRRAARSLSPSLKEDWTILQALYDGPHDVEDRARRWRRLAGRLPHSGPGMHIIRWGAVCSWLSLALGLAFIFWTGWEAVLWWQWAFAAAAAAITLIFSIPYVTSNYRIGRVARVLSARLRSLDRSTDSFRETIGPLPPRALAESIMPLDDGEAIRYIMVERLKRAAASVGYGSILFAIDRIDEPSVVSGDPLRMRTLMAPLFNNKFLQQFGIGIKMFLPLELKQELDRASVEFLAEARLDKQHVIEQLKWSGTDLAELCDARLRACGSTAGLTEFLASDLTRRETELILESAGSPREASKLLYRAIQIQAASIQPGQRPALDELRISRTALHAARKQSI